MSLILNKRGLGHLLVYFRWVAVVSFQRCSIAAWSSTNFSGCGFASATSWTDLSAGMVWTVALKMRSKTLLAKKGVMLVEA
jgi:hypothetical protein